MTSDTDFYRLIGTVLADKYAVQSVAGEGGFAIVYRAQHQLWQRPVAIKVFKGLEGIAPETRQQLMDDFLKEGALLAELSERSSAIAQARDVGMLTTEQGGSVPYMVLEWLEGSTLDAILQEDRLHGRVYGFEEAVQLVWPALDALSLAHSRGIAHRDVKPANIFVVREADGSTAIKLLDFGIAKVVQDAQKRAGEFAKTTGQMVSFTPLYGAPEQFSRALGATGPWTDVYAVALLLVEMMSGREALEGDDVAQIAYCSTDRSVRPTPRQRGALVSDEIEALFLRALAVDPQERFASCAELCAALRSTLAGGAWSPPSVVAPAVGTRTPSASLPPPPHSLTPRSVSGPHHGATALAATSQQTTAPVEPASAGARTPLLLGGVGLLAVLGVGGFWLANRPSEPTTDLLTTPVAPSEPVAPPAPPSKQELCGPHMVPIDGGLFFMGAGPQQPGAEDNEKPQHQVMLSPYCIDRYEVSVERFVECTSTGKCARPPEGNEFAGISKKDRALYDPMCNLRGVSNGSTVPEGRGKYPMNCIDYQSAERFCEQQGGHLPSEAQWEFAARGPDSRVYPWGDDPPALGHVNACGRECVAWAKANGDRYITKPMYDADDGFVATAPVGSFPNGVSPFGVHDMTGNVFEWVRDYEAPYVDSREPPKDPTGPAKGTERVIRGGAWNSTDADWMRPSFRYAAPPEMRSHGFGFRCAKPLPSEPEKP